MEIILAFGIDFQFVISNVKYDLFLLLTKNGVSQTISVSKQEIMNRAVAYNGNTNYADEGKKGTKACPN